MHDGVDVPKRVGQRGTFEPCADDGHLTMEGEPFRRAGTGVARLKASRSRRGKASRERRGTHDCAHLHAALDEVRNEVAADEAGRPGDRYTSHHSITIRRHAYLDHPILFSYIRYSLNRGRPPISRVGLSLGLS